MQQMMKMNKKIAIFLSFFLTVGAAYPLTIDEKKASLESGGKTSSQGDPKFLEGANEQLKALLAERSMLYSELQEKYDTGSSPDSLKGHIEKIREVGKKIAALQNDFKQEAINSGDREEYALWHQPETTLEQLVFDYGSNEYVYLIPEEIAAKKLFLESNLPIPQQSWEEMLELILAENGIGIRQLSPFLRSLYTISNNFSGIEIITANSADLDRYPSQTRVCYVLSPESSDAHRIHALLGKFSFYNTSSIMMIGSDLFIIARIAEVRQLLKVYDFVKSHQDSREYRLVGLSHGNADEIAKVLELIFTEQKKAEGQVDAPYSLLVMPMKTGAPALFLFGARREIEKAETIINEIEEQMGVAQEKTITLYTCKYSDAAELAQVLEQVYGMIIKEKISNDQNGAPAQTNGQQGNGIPPPPPPKTPPGAVRPHSTYDDGISIVVNPSAVDPSLPAPSHTLPLGGNFIVDQKTGSIIMVVEPGALDQLKELIKKLDVPKKMVQIDVLLFEKKITDQNRIGLNLLKLGDAASQKNKEGGSWNDIASASANKGILQFFFSRNNGDGWPAFDFVYNFLLAQEDVTINANPTITAINQTPAKIALVDEISINTGIVQIDLNGDTALTDSFVRAQYGITIEITPTIHSPDPNDKYNDTHFVTLDTNITFDTTRPASNDRPEVTRRNIKNQVRIADGESVILGGLRRKISEDERDAIPFLGEIPGFGKMFSTNFTKDSTTEMFIFLTPRIIEDPIRDFAQIKRDELCRRPGDTNEFLSRLQYARHCEKQRLMAGTMKMLFGRESPKRDFCGEYDGR